MASVLAHTTRIDREIRDWLRAHEYGVLEVTYDDLHNRGAMIRHFRKLARLLEGREWAQRIEEDASWYD